MLVALLVYNGRSFVPRTLESLAALRSAARQSGRNDVEIVVFDDASPEPGWSETLRELCVSHDFGYYCSPRNLGIPRNMSLALLYGQASNHDFVLLLNSDVVVASNLVDAMIAAADDPEVAGENASSHPAGRVASVTAWSNNASIFSLPNDDADRFLADQYVVDRVASSLASEFTDQPAELPVGMGFCISVAVDAVRAIGVMDPVFGRGYCEEVDWCCRASAASWRHVLATNTFVYHMGSATTRLAGLLAPGEQTVQVNEAIIDDRYPDYRRRVAAWEDAGGLLDVVSRGLRRLVTEAARVRGYRLDATWLPKNPNDAYGGGLEDLVQMQVSPDGAAPLLQGYVDGFRTEIPVGPEGILAAVGAVVGVAPAEVRISDHGSVASQLEDGATLAGVKVARVIRYPERV